MFLSKCKTTKLKQSNSQTGFTIVELMIATTVFAVLLLIASAAIVTIGRQFYKGIITARTHSVAVNISEEMSRGIQYSASPPRIIINGNIHAYCIADKEYVFEKGVVQDGSDPVFVRRDGCEPSWGGGPSAVDDNPSNFSETELLGDNMRLAELTLDDINTQSTYSLFVKVVYAPSDNDNELLNDPTGPNARCKSGIAGSQFCASSELSVTVHKRL
ncbi:hypothetical protein BH23PAT1_BH23PAT1_3180 [soil metagenome]